MKRIISILVFVSMPAWASTKPGVMKCVGNWNQVEFDLSGMRFGHVFKIQDLNGEVVADLVDEAKKELKAGYLSLWMSGDSCVYSPGADILIECRPSTVTNETIGFSYDTDLGDNFGETVTVRRTIQTKNVHIKLARGTGESLVLDLEFDAYLPGRKTAHFKHQRQFDHQRADNWDLTDWDNACSMQTRGD